MASGPKKNEVWALGEKRTCYCDMYDGRPHEESKRNWYMHQRRQAWADQRDLQSSIEPLVLNTQHDGDMPPNHEEEGHRSPTPDFNYGPIQHRSPTPDFGYGPNQNRSPTPEFNGQEYRRSPTPNVKEVVGHLTPMLQVYSTAGPVQDPSQIAGREEYGDSMQFDNTDSMFDVAVESTLYATSDDEQMLEAYVNTCDNYSPGNRTPFGPLTVSSGDESTQGNHEKINLKSQYEHHISSSETNSSSDLLDLGIDSEEELERALLSPGPDQDSAKDDIDTYLFSPNGEGAPEDHTELEYDDFPYTSLPHITIPDPVLRHLKCMQVRMDGNVAESTHRLYMDAFREFSGNSICKESFAKRELGDITAIKHVRYDVCRNNYICYAAFPKARACHICKEPRLDTRGKPLRTFDYIPIIHRLRLQYTDPEYVKHTMDYKKSFPAAATNEPHTVQIPRESTRDYWDSLLYSVVKRDRGLWTDHRDVGFIFSTDGFSLFKSVSLIKNQVGQFDVWPLLLINTNLPPSKRILKANMTLCGIIPGPENPKDIGSFLSPMVNEFLELQAGVRAWDGLRKEEFVLRANIVLIAGDTMAMAKLMKWTGPNSYHYCRFCNIYGISEGHIYCPLEPPRDRPLSDVQTVEPAKSGIRKETKRKKKSKKEEYFPERSWDPENLPLLTDAILRSNHKTVEDKVDFVWGKLVGTNGQPIFSCLKSIVYPWVFAPDVMHLVDENTPRLYLAHWMGLFRQREATGAMTAVEEAGEEVDNEGNSGKAKNTSLGKRKSRDKGNGKNPPKAKAKAKAKARAGTKANTKQVDSTAIFQDSNYLSTKVLGIVGAEIADSRQLIPTRFGKAFRDIKYHASYKATELLNFMHIVSPIILNGRLGEEEYSHWHHLVLSTEKTRKYQLTMEEIAEMERDMVTAVTGYERMYYKYKLDRISACTSQVHGLLHLATAMRVCGPNPIYHQYPMERTCGFIKAMCHSRSTANRNLSLQILEQEQLKFLPYIAKLPKGFRKAPIEDRKLFGLPAKDKCASESYADCLLMRPKQLRILNQYERTHLRAFCTSLTGDSVRSQAAGSSNYSQPFQVWGRAIAGRGFSNEDAYEVVGSKMSNTGFGAAEATKRDDSYIRYIVTRDDGLEVSRFGRVMFYLPFQLPKTPEREPELLLLAYVECVKVGRVRKRKLAYKIDDGKIKKEFVDLEDIQELVGAVRSRGREFVVSKTSCFWPKKDFEWKEVIDNVNLFDAGAE